MLYDTSSSRLATNEPFWLTRLRYGRTTLIFNCITFDHYILFTLSLVFTFSQMPLSAFEKTLADTEKRRSEAMKAFYAKYETNDDDEVIDLRTMKVFNRRKNEPKKTIRLGEMNSYTSSYRSKCYVKQIMKNLKKGESDEDSVINCEIEDEMVETVNIIATKRKNGTNETDSAHNGKIKKAPLKTANIIPIKHKRSGTKKTADLGKKYLNGCTSKDGYTRHRKVQAENRNKAILNTCPAKTSSRIMETPKRKSIKNMPSTNLKDCSKF